MGVGERERRQNRWIKNINQAYRSRLSILTKIIKLVQEYQNITLAKKTRLSCKRLETISLAA